MNHHPWRPRPPPPIQGNICPTCSNSHFPFCPPSSLLFTEPPRYQSINQLPYTTPYDPYIDHRGPAMNLHRSFVPNQRPSWIRSPNYYHGSVGLKRMRIGEDENDRRLKLIRDHGSTPYPYPNHDYSRLSPFENLGQPVGPTIRAFVNAQPPLPTSPPPPLPLEPQSLRYSLPKTPSLFPVIPVTSSATSSADIASLRSPVPHNYYDDNTFVQTPTGFSPEEFHVRQASSKSYIGDKQTFPVRPLSSDTPKPVDASHIFKHPHRASRPDRIVVILRGLPGSGKSYLAKMIRDVEVENGGDAPRIHSMDDYFMTEVEKAEENDSSMGSARGKNRVMKVMEYCYEPEMEEVYRLSMLKAFKKTLDEGVFSFIIVDDRNLRIAHFAQFWATAKRSGYEVYLLEATYKDPAGCAARNVHSFSQDDIELMAGQWEEAPSLYMKLDIKTLLHGDHSEETDIQEVDMDTEDAEPTDNPSEPDNSILENASVSHKEEYKHSDEPLSEDDEKVGHTSREEDVKDLRKSKWSDDVDDDDDYDDISNGKIVNSSALSGLLQAYSNKSGKSVRWGDEGKNTGFSISAAKRENVFSLVIGPGAGYNLKSNPLGEEDKLGGNNGGEWRKQSVFQEQLRAEKEAFKAVFDKRRHRISGMEHLEDGYSQD